MLKVSQPMAASGSSPFASGVPARVPVRNSAVAEVVTGNDGIRDGDKPSTGSLLDKQSGVGNVCTHDPNSCNVGFCDWPRCNSDTKGSGRETLGKPGHSDQEAVSLVGPPRLSSQMIPAQGAGSSGSEREVSLTGRPPVSFMVPQCPKGKQRHQTVVTLRCERCQRTVKGQRKECPYCLNPKMYFLFSNEYTPAEQRDYEKFVASCALQAMRGREKFVGPTKLQCRFWFPIPKSRAKKLRDGDWHCQRDDRDNCEKSIMDACNGIVWCDDCVVCAGDQECRWTTGIPRTEVTISSL